MINKSIIDQISVEKIARVTFYKRDELTTDLICCDVEADDQAWSFHEEMQGWDALLRHLEKLPKFKKDWLKSVLQPPFASCRTIAFSRG